MPTCFTGLCCRSGQLELDTGVYLKLSGKVDASACARWTAASRHGGSQRAQRSVPVRVPASAPARCAPLVTPQLPTRMFEVVSIMTNWL